MSTERRRSSRIVALEEKRQKEKQRKLALASAKKQKIIETKNKEKGKAVIDDAGNDHLVDFVEVEKLGPTDKGWKDRAFYQLISIFKAIQEGRPTNDESTSSVTNVSSLNTVPEKHVLESVIDFLQRKDSDELFGDPISFNMVENCHLNVNEPIDFGTIRAKIHDGMYSTLEQFKRDVYLISFNGMNAYPSSSKYYKVAKGIGCHAIKIFESLSADPEHFDSKVGFNKRQCKKPAGDRKLGTPRLVRASTKSTGRNSTRYKAAKTDKRVTYQPLNNNSLVSEVLNCINKSNLQLNTCTTNYKDSLLRFVKDLGPTAQSVAAKKIEAFNSQQLQHTNTSNPNLHENALAPQLTHQLTPQPQALKQPITHNSSQKPFPPLQITTKPLTIPGIATHQNRNANNTIPNNANIRNNTDRGKSLLINDNCQSYAAALMYNSVYNTDEKGKNQIGVESSNARGTLMDTTNYALNGNMASRVENMSNYIRHQNNSALSDSGSSSNVPNYVHPSRVIPILRPQLQSNPLNLIPSNRFPRPFQIPSARPIMSSMNSSRLGHVMSQPRPQYSLPAIFDNNNLINSSLVYPMGYSRPMNSMFGMNMPSSESLLNSQVANQFPNEQEASLFCLNTPYYHGGFQALLNSSEFSNHSSPRVQVPRRMNPLGPSSSIEFNNNLHPMHVNNQMMNLLGPSSSSGFQIPFLNGALYYNGGGGALQTQQERANSQLLDNDYGQPNLTLGL